jgi:phosphoglycerol transferase MdoB-like AlkP superfamily enzyme
MLCGSLLLTLLVLPPNEVLWTNPTLVLSNMLPILIVMLAIYSVCGRVFSTLGIVSLLTVGIRYLHNQKLAVLEIPLTINDALLSSQVLASPGLVLSYLGWPTIFGICIFVLLMLAVFFKETTVVRGRYRLGLLAALSIVLMLSSPLSQSYLELPQSPWEPDPSLRKVGIVAYLIQDYLRTSELQVPVANRETLAATKARFTLPAPGSNPQQHPDIILWLSESFFDPRILQGIDSCGQIPTFCALSQVNTNGSFTVPTFGGRTIRTEFEILTGVPMALVSEHEYPYMSLTNTPVNSIAWELQAQGYNTTAIHNHNRRFWRRPVAMKNLGFQRWIGVEDFKTKKKVGKWHADSMLTDAVINLLEEPQSNSPQLIFAISMQAHGPHGNQSNLPKNQVDAIVVPDKIKPQNVSSLQQFFFHLRSADTELQRFSSYIHTRKRPTLVLFFGDHLPGLSGVYNDLGFDNGLGPGQQQTPFLLFANYAMDKPDNPSENLAAWQLPTLLLKAANLLGNEAFAWFNLLYEQMNWSRDAIVECQTSTCDALLQFQLQQLSGPGSTMNTIDPPEKTKNAPSD